ncbi:hypothetical protein NDU88_010834 [Pleurodeles waltl]|uniref:Ig-like domain-containing protein n=1 Tax=Pleurodeles waltl TaxID=8319 RepID=A0AAV7PWW7_PLEWA|nr:hypothetical protein NDU88_010834 [Pleurodeles waltl]
MWALGTRTGVLPALLLLLPLIDQAFAAITLSANTSINALVGNNISMTIEHTPATLSPIIIWKNSTISFATIYAGIVIIDESYRDRVTVFPSGSIFITNAKLWYSGNYTVTLTAVGESSETATVQVTVYEPIGVVSLSAYPAQVTEGDSSVTLSYMLSQGQGTATWTKDGVSIVSNSTYTLSGNTLKISNPNTTDSGLFNCTVSNPVSRNFGVYNLTVNVKPAGLSPGAIAGIVVGSVLGALLIILLLVLLVCCIRKRKGQKQRPSASYPNDKSKNRAQMDGIRTVEGRTAALKADWIAASVSSSTLRHTPPVYNTHNTTFRNAFISTISGVLHSNDTLSNRTDSTVVGMTKKMTKMSATQV